MICLVFSIRYILIYFIIPAENQDTGCMFFLDRSEAREKLAQRLNKYKDTQEVGGGGLLAVVL